MAASGTAAHKPMRHTTSAKMHKPAQKPMTDQTATPGANASTDTKGQ
jgi:hypothetical protein